ncbi:endonuclease [Candidatus Cerribacteria bacterium 'Amazon FNV 2010 28 9']|uniref:Endonuclease n=1 Tax=Candidatus Cerribacteria bacterium 'Amazon FNV 2010 28 9' TaxID=2081795 RepID=A0A317JMQ2_9BACT|nr:MAG: endonuclease [Candidatus Cerribacteria bacterium 'Amazon FNV 2010 28 9']
METEDCKGYIYILTTKDNNVLYIGSTVDLKRRLRQHKNGHTIFTHKYHLSKLVWYQEFASISNARIREKQMKKWNRQWKINIINKLNPHWTDLDL